MCGMDTSILYEKTIALWHVIMIAVGIAIVLVAAPPAMRMGFGAHGEEAPDKKNCFRVTWVAALIAGLGTPLVVAILCYYFVGDLLVYQWHWALKLVVGTLLAGSIFGVCLVAMDFLLVGRSAMVWSRVLPAAIVCAVGVSAVDIALAGSFGRLRALERRNIDVASLDSIFHGLNAYYNTYHVYPDDLRRLVDAQLVEKVALVSISDRAQSEIRASRSSPYSGPVDFTYVKLPPDADGDIVWVCQSPSLQDDDGAFVLYKCGAVKWQSPQGVVSEMAKSVERMRQFTLDQMTYPYPPYAYGAASKPAPAATSTSVPASAPSTRAATVPASTPAPASAPASMPATSLASAPATSPISMPATAPASMPASWPASLPATFPATGPAATQATRPTTLPASMPASIPATRPTTAPSTVPASMPTTRPATVTSSMPAPATAPTSAPAPAPIAASSRPATAPGAAPASVPGTLPASAPATAPSSGPASAPASGPAGESK
jgi:hypothetical protein